MSILALCPSRGRPKAAHETLASFQRTIRDEGSRIVFIVDRDDPTLADYPQAQTHVVKPTGSMGGALRLAQPEVIGDATSVGMIGDDNRFNTPGWDVIFDTHLTERLGMCYGDDGLQHQRLPTSWWVSRKLADAFPLAPPMLDHLYMDNWWLSLAEGANCIRYFGDVDIEHLHPLAGKAAMDRTYERSKRFISHDRDAFRRWERRDRHRDVLRAKSLIGSGEKRRVLADWHHPALWESLAILFEDRFGWELYSMGGNDWMQKGWTLRAGPPIGWSEADYLCMDGAVDKGTHHELTEREYPSRPRKQVTVKQAQAMKWDFVLGSVPEHQKTFPLLAKSLHARFIHQVGNAKHPVDHVADQIVLASSNVRVRGRSQAISYHQPFSMELFGPSPITDPLAVTSLMLRLDWTSCDYRWLSEAKGIRWSAPGGADPNAREYLAPMSRVADVMRASGWIWMDKRVGDGFGHIIHNAAAMGRPIIGHASHYKGMTAEPFWQDMKTAIDLDKHEPREALRLVRAISSDPEWHQEISESMADLFARTVDFDGEAEKIRAALI